MKIDVKALALKAGFEPYEVYCLSGNGESDRICCVGEYPCGEWATELVRLTLQAVCDAIPYVVNCYDESAAECVQIVESMMP